MSSFFLRKGTRPKAGIGSNEAKKNAFSKQPELSRGSSRKRRALEEEIESEDDSELSADENEENDLLSDDEEETAAEKRLRLAKEYLATVERRTAEKEGDTEGVVVPSRDALAEQLKLESLERLGRLHRRVASTLAPAAADSQSWLQMRGRHRLSPTCLTLSLDGRHCYSGSKDGVVLKSDLETGACVGVWKPFKGHRDTSERHSDGFCVSSLAVSNDGNMLCVGGADSRIHVFDASSEQPTLIKALKGHRGAITGLTYRRNSTQVFSSSEDRTVKAWDMTQMGFIDTMFGHDGAVLSVDSLTKERCVSAGGADRSLRMWKLTDESQLVFNGYASCGSIECVRLINDDHFVSGALDGSLSVWSIFKKKPVCVQKSAHGMSTEPSWITCVATCRYTDLIATGASDGSLRLWSVAEDYKRLLPTGSIPLRGFVNDVCINENHSLLVAAVGQEHKRGRWWSDKKARNRIVAVPLLTTSTGD